MQSHQRKRRARVVTKKSRWLPALLIVALGTIKPQRRTVGRGVATAAAPRGVDLHGPDVIVATQTPGGRMRANERVSGFLLVVKGEGFPEHVPTFRRVTS